MKKFLLISSASHTFLPVFNSIIPKLANQFQIVVLLSRNKPSISPLIIESLDHWKKEKIVFEYLLPPTPQKTLKFNFFMKAAVKQLRTHRFNIWLTRGEMQVIDRYILECVLLESCLRIVMSPLLTYLFRHRQFVEKLLSASENCEKLPQVKQLVNKLTVRDLIKKIKETRTAPDLFRKSFRFLISHSKNFYKIRKHKLIDRCLMPWLMTRKEFQLESFDEITQLGSGRCDAYIFCDELEVQAHKILFNTKNVFLARFPSNYTCRCLGKEKGKTILVPLSGWENINKIPEEILWLHYRDYKNLLSRTGANKLHLRCHPSYVRGRGYPDQLHEYLTNHAIDCEIVKPEKPIPEIICDYMGIAGFASAALREARASCDYAFVIGFTALSKYYYKDPQFVFGSSEGIGWIEEDGSFESSIFEKKKYVPFAKKSIPDIIDQLLNQSHSSEKLST